MISVGGTRQDDLATVLELRLPKDEEEEFAKGFVYKLHPEVLTKGYTVLVAGEGKDKISEERKVSFSMFPVRLSNLRKSFAGIYYALVTDGLEKSGLLSILKERKSAVAVIDEVNRLDCKAGMSSVIPIDKDNGIVKDFSKAEANT